MFPTNIVKGAWERCCPSVCPSHFQLSAYISCQIAHVTGLILHGGCICYGTPQAWLNFSSALLIPVISWPLIGWAISANCSIVLTSHFVETFMMGLPRVNNVLVTLCWILAASLASWIMKSLHMFLGKWHAMLNPNWDVTIFVRIQFQFRVWISWHYGFSMHTIEIIVWFGVLLEL